MNINELKTIITKERVAMYTKGLSTKQQGYLTNCILQKCQGAVIEYSAYIENMYEENITHIANNIASELESILNLRSKKMSGKYEFFNAQECKVGLDTSTALLKLWGNKYSTQYGNGAETIRLDNFFRNSKGFEGLMESRIYLLNTTGIGKLEDDMEYFVEQLCKECCSLFMECKNFKIVTDTYIDFNNLTLYIGAKKEHVQVKKVVKKTENKKFINENYYEISDEDLKTLERYDNVSLMPTVLNFVSTFGCEYESLTFKNQFCKNNYGFFPSTINTLYYFSEESVGDIIKEKGYNAFNAKMNNALLYPLNTVNGNLAGFIVRRTDKRDIAQYGKHTMFRGYTPAEKNGKQEESLKKSLLVWGLDKVKAKIDNGQAIDKFMESIAKALIVNQNFPELNVIATMSCEVTWNQFALIKSIIPTTTTIIMGFDNDNSGRKANVEVAFKLLKIGYTKIQFLNKKANYMDKKDENDLVVYFMREKGLNVFSANIEFRNIFKKMVNFPMTFQFPTEKQLDILETAEYTLTDMTNLFLGTTLDIENSKYPNLKTIVNNIIANKQMGITSFKELNNIFVKGGCAAIQTEIRLLANNNFKKEWLVTLSVEPKQDEVKKEIKAIEVKVEKNQEKIILEKVVDIENLEKITTIYNMLKENEKKNVLDIVKYSIEIEKITETDVKHFVNSKVLLDINVLSNMYKFARKDFKISFSEGVYNKIKNDENLHTSIHAINFMLETNPMYKTKLIKDLNDFLLTGKIKIEDDIFTKLLEVLQINKNEIIDIIANYKTKFGLKFTNEESSAIF